MNVNSSPARITFYAALLTAIVPSVTCYIFGLDWWAIFSVFLITTGLGYAIIGQMVNRFIYRKIKIIYKGINVSNRELLKAMDSEDPIGQVSNDVTAWANDRNKEIAELKQLENFRREFIGNVSHELKTPIFQIQGYIHTLLDGAMADEKVNYRFLEKVSNSSDRLAELVEDLTAINRIESGNLNLNEEVILVRELVQEVYDEVDYLAKEKNITCKFKQSSDTDLKVLADRLRIKQVLINLIVNALKYGKSGGYVTCGTYDMDTNVLIEISDNGDGIPEEALPRLFERFYRVEQSRTRDAGGSGLGLSIAKHIVEAHGHTISVRSKLGKGTTFGFTLSKANKA